MHRGTGNGAKPTSSENEAEKGEEKGQGEAEKEVSYCKLRVLGSHYSTVHVSICNLPSNVRLLCMIQPSTVDAKDIVFCFMDLFVAGMNWASLVTVAILQRGK